MIGECFGEKGISSRGMYIRSTSDIPPKCKDIRNSYISQIGMICEVLQIYRSYTQSASGHYN